VAVICLLVISITYVIGQMRGVGIAFSNILNLSIETGLWSAWRWSSSTPCSAA
jgi:cation/acetate symporter